MMGWDAITSKPGVYKAADCRVCNARMDVKRDVTGPTSSAEAMRGGEHLHDVFTCPNSEQDWHAQVLKLKLYLQNLPSAALSKLVEEEIKLILETKKPTK